MRQMKYCDPGGPALSLLRQRSEWPSARGTPKQRDKFPPSHFSLSAAQQLILALRTRALEGAFGKAEESARLVQTSQRTSSTFRADAKDVRYRVNGVSKAVSVSNYFGTPTNRAPVNLPSSPISGA